MSSTAGVRAATTRSTIERPPSSMRAFGLPPIRVLLPPACTTPVTFTSGHHDGALPDDRRRVHGHVEYGRRRAARGRAAIEHQVEPIGEVRDDRAGRCR